MAGSAFGSAPRLVNYTYYLYWGCYSYRGNASSERRQFDGYMEE